MSEFARLRLLANNAADESTITVTPAPTITAENLQNERRERVCRVDGTTMTIDVEFDAIRAVGGVVISHHNFSTPAKWRIEGWSGPNRTGTKTIDRPNQIIYPLFPWGDFAWGSGVWAGNIYSEWAASYAVAWLAESSVRSMRITVTDPLNPAGYLEAARLRVGRVIEPDVNFNWGAELGWVDPSSQQRTRGGSLISSDESTYRRMSLRLDWLNEEDRAEVLEVARTVGRRRDVFVSAYPERGDKLERDHQMDAKLVSQKTGAKHTTPCTFSAPLIFEEV